MAAAPALNGSGSWIISCRATGKVICEVFERGMVELISPDKCLIEPAGEYLARLNAEKAAAASSVKGETAP